MSEERQDYQGGNGEPKPVAIVHLELHADNSLKISGPVKEPAIFVSMLERARLEVTVAATVQRLHREVEQAQNAPRIYTPDGIRVQSGKA